MVYDEVYFLFDVCGGLVGFEFDVEIEGLACCVVDVLYDCDA